MKPRPSVLKRQREQAKRDRKAMKAEKRLQRKNEPGGGGPEIIADDFEVPEEELTESVS